VGDGDPPIRHHRDQITVTKTVPTDTKLDDLGREPSTAVDGVTRYCFCHCWCPLPSQPNIDFRPSMHQNPKDTPAYPKLA
jgi:hypothetical protein